MNDNGQNSIKHICFATQFIFGLFLWLSKRRLNILNIQNCTQLVFYKGNNTLDKKEKYNFR